MKFQLPPKPDLSPEAQQRIEAGRFDVADIWAIIWTTVKKFRDKPSVILWSSFLLLLLWGFHGNLDIILRITGKSWIQRITGGLGWGKLLISYLAGFFLVVVIPCIIIKFHFKSDLRAFGLGWPSAGNRRKSVTAFLKTTTWGSSTHRESRKTRVQCPQV